MPFVREQSGGTDRLHTYTASAARSGKTATFTFDISDIDTNGNIPISNMGIGVMSWSSTVENNTWAGYYNPSNFKIVSNQNGTVTATISITGNLQRPWYMTANLYVWA